MSSRLSLPAALAIRCGKAACPARENLPAAARGKFISRRASIRGRAVLIPAPDRIVPSPGDIPLYALMETYRKRIAPLPGDIPMTNTGGTPSLGLSLRPGGVLPDFIDSCGPLRIAPSPGEHFPGVCFSGPFPVPSHAGCFVPQSPVSFLRASASLRRPSFASRVSSRSRIPRAFIFRWRWLRSSPTWAAVRETFQANSSSLRSR